MAFSLKQKKAVPSWLNLKDPSRRLVGMLPRPTQFFKNGKEYWIITPHYANTKTVIQYDVEQDIFSEFASYPDGFKPMCHGTAFNPNTNDLHFFCGYNHHFGVLNIKSMEWDIKSTVDDRIASKCNNYYNVPGIMKVASQYLPPPINEVHLFGYNRNCKWTQHLKYDSVPQRFRELVEEPKVGHFKRPQMVWVSQYNMLMVMGGEYADDSSEKIYCCHIHRGGDKGDDEYEWTEYEAKLPMEPTEYMEVIVFGSILIVFCPHLGPAFSEPDSKKAGIWCLDLQTKQWFKSKVYPPVGLHLHVILSEDNFLHCLRFTAEPRHFKMRLMDVIPEKLRWLRLKNFLVVVQAFCHCSARKFGTDSIPDDIIQLILNIYPLFL